MDEQMQTQTPTPTPTPTLSPAQSGGMPKFVIPTVVAALIVLAVIGYYFYNSGQNDTGSMTQSPTGQTASGAPSAMENTAGYKDGTYEMIGNYVSPGGPREVGVTLTLANGVISDASAEVMATDATSQRFQGEFVNNFKPMVIGKSIDEVVLEKVSGSSLTPKGFNDAVNKIKTAAANS
jgi:hypothetical protein